MARKQITAIRLVAGSPETDRQVTHVDRVTWIEDGKTFPQEEPREKVARAVNSGEAFYVRGPDSVETPVTTQLRHGKYFLTSRPDASKPDALLALPTY